MNSINSSMNFLPSSLLNPILSSNKKICKSHYS